MYKLLALDLDDTLLNDKGEISEVNRKAILKAQKKGIKIVLASGRPTGAMTRFIEELELDKNGGYIVSFNGGEIINCETRESVFKKALTIEAIHRVYDASKKHNCSIITYRGDNIVSETMDEYIGVEVELTKMPLIQENSFKEAVDFEGVKCIVLQEPSYLKKVEKLMKDEFSDLSISISKPFFLEI
ncbi:MAG: HAD-IIB family hydrolase, partial [Fusobacteriaceae bacterium]|nr:HAD-IIB family hydrolase [Fusobacteriaceae bacterium]